MPVRRCLIRWKLVSRLSVLRLELGGLGLDVSVPRRKNIETPERRVARSEESRLDLTYPLQSTRQQHR
jgi:hypothetical protein